MFFFSLCRWWILEKTLSYGVNEEKKVLWFDIVTTELKCCPKNAMCFCRQWVWGNECGKQRFSIGCVLSGFWFDEKPNYFQNRNSDEPSASQLILKMKSTVKPSPLSLLLFIAKSYFVHCQYWFSIILFPISFLCAFVSSPFNWSSKQQKILNFLSHSISVKITPVLCDYRRKKNHML